MPLLLLWLFLYPTSVQLHHHHTEEVCSHVPEGISLHTLHEACAVCDFHFPIFSNPLLTIADAPTLISYEKLAINYSEPFLSTSLQVTSVRGPPTLL